MIRYLISGVCFLFVFVMETSFFSSLPSVFAIVPLVFALSVYLIQHEGLTDGLIWIFAYGFLLQNFHLSIAPWPVLSFSIAGLASFLSSRHLFSNRSLYGVVGCAWIGYLCLAGTEALLMFVRTFGNETTVFWVPFLVRRGLEFLLLGVTIMVFFSFARHIRFFLRSQSF